MSFRPRSYPHPVLSPFTRDYVDGSELFGVFDRRSEGGELIIDYDITLNSSRLNEFRALDTGAFLALDIYSKGSRWRKLYSLKAARGAIKIPETQVFGTVEVTPMLLSANDGELEFAGINKEYSSSRFTVQEGDVLAHGDTYFLESDHHASSNDGESLISFELSEGLDPNEYEIGLTYDGIVVFAGKNVMQVTKAMSANPAFRPYLFMSFYKDAFIEAIGAILSQYKAEEEPEEAWAKGLLAFIESQGLSLDTIEDGERNSIQKFVLRMIASDGVGAISKRLDNGQAPA
jgi:hypothetical protein